MVGDYTIYLKQISKGKEKGILIRAQDHARGRREEGGEERRGGGESAYERGGDARRKFWIKPIKETNRDMAQPFFDP